MPSIRSLGSPQLPSPDAGLSPSLGTRAGHGERRACDAHRHRHKQQTHLLSQLGERPASCSAYSRLLGLSDPPTLVEGSHRDLDLGSPQHPPRFTSAHHLNHSGGRSHTKHTQKLSVKQSQMSLLKLHQLMNSTHNTKGLIVTFC